MGEREGSAESPTLADGDDGPPRVVASDGESASTAAPPQWARPTGGDFGWRGRALVGMLVLSFLVIPSILVLLAHRPSLVGSLGLTFQDAYLALPMIPAIGLALVAVWAALHARRR